MTQVFAGTTALFRDRDLFIQVGAKLCRFRICAPVQIALLLLFFSLVAFAGYASARLVARSQGRVVTQSDPRTRLLEQRQALIEAALTGQRLDPAMIDAAVK